MSITSNFPAIKPSLLLDFANTKQLDPRITFTRASTATYYGTQTAKAEENLFTYSKPENAGWVKLGTATLTENNATAPDGTSTAALLASPATGDYIYQSPAATVSGQTYTFSVFVKNSTATISYLWGRLSATSYDVKLNWSGATLSSLTTGSGSASFSAAGNDWYRVVITYTAAENAVRHRIYGGDNSSATGNILVWGAQLEARSAVSAYTVTTTATITNYIPQLLTAASGVARFDNNPTTFESLGLEIEESRTNLLTYSEQFDNAAWTKTNASITANTIVSPDGTVNADKHIPNSGATLGTGTSETRIGSANISRTAGTSYSLNVYAKAGELNSVRVASVETGNSVTGNFNLSTGVATVVAGTGATASMLFVGNGWYRCTITWTQGTTESQQVRFTAFDSVVTTGNGYSGIYIWGAQLEAGAFATSYIPTVASQVTRAADAASMTGTNFSSWYNASEGTVYFESQTAQGTSSYAYSLFGTSTSNRIFANYTSSLRMNSGVRVNGTFDVSVDTPNSSAPLNTFGKGATAYKVNDFGFSWNGATALTDTSTTLPIVLQLDIGNNNGTATNYLNGTIRKIAYYPLRVTDAQLQGLTS